MGRGTTGRPCKTHWRLRRIVTRLSLLGIGIFAFSLLALCLSAFSQPSEHHSSDVEEDGAEPGTTAIRQWAARFAQQHTRVDEASLQASCGNNGDGFVFVKWCNVDQGTGNCLNRILNAALIGVAFNKPILVVGTDRGAFDAGLRDYGRNGKSMPWLNAPLLMELRTADRGWINKLPCDVHKLDYTAVCSDMLGLDVIELVSLGEQWEFKRLALHHRLPEPVQRRVRELTTEGVNAYGLMLRALWPHGLTRANGLLRHPLVGGPFTAGVHLRCFY